MTASFFKSRCLICLKGFEIPKIDGKPYDSSLYYDKTQKIFAHFTWDNKKEINSLISDFLFANPKFQEKNDDTKGNTVRQLVAVIADGNWEPILGFNRCPRCGIKLNSVSNTVTGFKEISDLTFVNIFRLNKEQQMQTLFQKTKNGL